VRKDHALGLRGIPLSIAATFTEDTIPTTTAKDGRCFRERAYLKALANGNDDRYEPADALPHRPVHNLYKLDFLSESMRQRPAMLTRGAVSG